MSTAGLVVLVVVAVLAASAATAGPLLVVRHLNRQRKLERIEDREREDLVAKKLQERQNVSDEENRTRAKAAADVAHRLLDDQRILREATAEVKRVAATAARSVDRQLQQIHTLVNSDMTAARLEQVKSERAKLTALQRVVNLTTDAGQEPDRADLEAIESTEAEIENLEAILADRREQQRIVEEQEVRDQAENGTDEGGQG